MPEKPPQPQALLRFGNDHFYQARLRQYAQAHLLVLRPILLGATEYIQHLIAVRDWHGNRIPTYWVDALRPQMFQEHYWMIEWSVPELFSANLRKLGEVLIRTDQLPGKKRDLTSFILARLPGYFALLAGGASGKPDYFFIPSGLDGHAELIHCEERKPSVMSKKQAF